MKTPIVIVDDHTLLSQAIAKLVESFDDFHVLYTCGHGQELLTKLKGEKTQPKIVLMDINMPILNGIETTQIITEEYPDIHVIALTMEEDEKMVLKMIRAGAKGYLIKDTQQEVLLEALTETLAKGYYHTNTVTNILLNSITHPQKEENFDLKDREKEFIEYACTDMTYKEIAGKMFLSPKTIDNYRDSVFAKLNVKNRIGLVLFAIKNGFMK